MEESKHDTDDTEIADQVDNRLNRINDCLVVIVDRLDMKYHAISIKVSQYMILVGCLMMLMIMALGCLVYFNYDSREQILHIYERINTMDSRN